MATPRITIDSFSKGVVDDITRNTGMASIFACDIFTKPGRIRASERLIEDNDDNITTDDVILASISPYRYAGGPVTAELFGMGSGRLYYRLDATSAWTHLHTLGVASNDDIIAFGSSLYYSANEELGQLQGDPTVAGNYTDAYKFLFAASGAGVMEVFASSLYIAKERYIAKLEADEVNFTRDALLLPVGTRISCMTTWNDRLVIGTSNTLNEKPGTVYIWDGVSEFPEQAIDLPVSGIQAVFNFNNRLYVVIQGKFYRYTGSEFEIEFVLPGLGDDSTFDVIQIGRNSLTLYKERMLIAAASVGPVQVGANFKGGVYAYGRRNINDNYALTLEHEFSTGITVKSLNVGAMYTGYDPVFSSDIFVVAYKDHDINEAHVDILNTADVYPNSAYFVTPAYEIASDFGRLIKGVKLFFNDNIFDPDIARHKVVVKYRVGENIDYDDDSVNWTTLGAIDYDNKDAILYGVYERPNRIQFRFEITDNSATAGKYVEIVKIEIF